MMAVYGPVPSWRLGASLGVDPICKRKVCSFDCVYCQLGRTTDKTAERRAFIRAPQLKKDLSKALGECEPEVVTFSGTGEPTLASNLGELVGIVRKATSIPVAILTNSSLVADEGVRNDLMGFDIVSVKLDASTPETFKRVNHPLPSIDFAQVLGGLRRFSEDFQGELHVQCMFVDENKGEADGIAGIARGLKPAIVHLDTPLRLSPAPPLAPEELSRIKEKFSGLNAISVYDIKKPAVEPIDAQETIVRRPG